ncbi:MAG: hypothetical protein QXX17_03715 [Conexivisphaerales archaeon]
MKKLSVLICIPVLLVTLVNVIPVFAQTPTIFCNITWGKTAITGQVYIAGYLEIKDASGGCLTGIAGQTIYSDYMVKHYNIDGSCGYMSYYGQATTDNQGHFLIQYGPWWVPKVLGIEVNYYGNGQYSPANQWSWIDINPADYC